jgi:hypothetical protein
MTDLFSTPQLSDHAFLPLLAQAKDLSELRRLATQDWSLYRRDHYDLRDFIQRTMSSLPLIQGQDTSLIRMNLPPHGEKEAEEYDSRPRIAVIEEKVPHDNKVRLLLHCLSNTTLSRTLKWASAIPSFLRLAARQCPASPIALRIQALDTAEDRRPDLIWLRLQHSASAPTSCSRHLHLFMAMVYGESWRSTTDISCLLFMWRHRKWLREMVQSIRVLPTTEWLTSGVHMEDTDDAK